MNIVKPYVLLVEDNALARKMGQIILEELNCRVNVAETGCVAIESAAKEKFDFIFIDIGLPDIDGLAVLSQIRSSNCLNCETNIIMLTAQSDSEYQRQAGALGATGYIQKPLSLELGKEILINYKLTHQ